MLYNYILQIRTELVKELYNLWLYEYLQLKDIQTLYKGESDTIR